MSLSISTGVHVQNFLQDCMCAQQNFRSASALFSLRCPPATFCSLGYPYSALRRLWSDCADNEPGHSIQADQTTYSITSMARTRMARYRGWFELFFQSLQNSSKSSRKQIFMFFFLFYHVIVCCVYSLESPHRGDSNEYTQHTIIVYKIEKISLNYRYLLPELVPWLTLSGSN